MGTRGVGRSGLAVAPRAPVPPATPAVNEVADPLAGATIVVHDLSRPAAPPWALGAPAPVPAADGGGASGAAGQPGAAQGLSPYWRRLQAVVGGGLVALCLGLFGYQFWLGRSPTSVTLGVLGAGSGSRVEIKMY